MNPYKPVTYPSLKDSNPHRPHLQTSRTRAQPPPPPLVCPTQTERVDGQPYDLRSEPSPLLVRVHIMESLQAQARGSAVACAFEWRSADEVRCSFPVRAAGTYWISVTVGGPHRHVAGSPYRRVFLAGEWGGCGGKYAVVAGTVITSVVDRISGEFKWLDLSYSA